MSFKSNSLLAVKGARYSQRDESRERTTDRQTASSSSVNANGHYTNFFLQHHQQQQQQNVGMARALAQPPQQVAPAHQQLAPQTTTTSTNIVDTMLSEEPVQSQQSRTVSSEKCWKMDDDGSTTDAGDMVTIHVCDENQQISKDFCCKRDILVRHMKYFEKFLAENENGYDDIDISVHCDVEIFEWLMSYIHDPDRPPKIEKSIIVSILISSEFLQMDALVDLCVQQVAGSLNEIIKLPIDLSCISEKLINRIAYLTSPKTLSETKDRKDKILTKLYKRRVELDFSRKGSTAPRSGSFSGNLATTTGTGAAAATAATAAVAPTPAAAPITTRTIAASLTCCRHCGLAYLDNYVGLLTCRASPPTVDFRGQLASRHSAISGGMGWDAIYWHVWAACVVFRVDGIMISALEVDRYVIEPDGLLIRGSPPREDGASAAGGVADTSTDGAGGLLGGLLSPASQVSSHSNASSGAASPLPPRPPPIFSLSQEDDHQMRGVEPRTYKLKVCKRPELVPPNPSTTSSLNPLRPPEILTQEIFDLLLTQMKYIVGLSHKLLIQKTMKAAVDAAKAMLPSRAVDFGELLWRNAPRGTTYEGSVVTVELPRASMGPDAAERRRGRSPGRGARALPAESRKHSMSLPKNSVRGGAVAGGIASSNKGAALTSPTAASATNGADLGTTSNDSDQEGPPSSSARPPAGGHAERRSRSSSTGARLSSLSGSGRNLKRLSVASPSARAHSPVPTDDSSVDEEVPPAAVLNGTALDQQSAKQIAVLQSLPPEVQVRIFQTKGPVHGQWMVAHPLQVRAAAHSDAVRAVMESSIVAAKKQEWELDIMREWDEKRMETFERFLVSRRNRPAEAVVAETRRPGRRNLKPAVEYYRDKGRQASNR